MNQLFVGAVSSGVPVGLIVTLVLIAAAAIAIAVAVYKIKHGIRQISRNMFGTDSFVQGINNQKREMSETPTLFAGYDESLPAENTKRFPGV